VISTSSSGAMRKLSAVASLVGFRASVAPLCAQHTRLAAKRNADRLRENDFHRCVMGGLNSTRISS